jgi:hypothetical protein
LESEDLWSVVQQCWRGFLEETIARAFAGHHQIVNAIASCHGGDEFTKEHNGLHCGIRKHFVPYFEEGGTQPAGVEVVSSLEGATMDAIELKYSVPDLLEEETGVSLKDLSEQELQFLQDHLEQGSALWEEVSGIYSAMSLGLETGSADEEDETDEEDEPCEI